MVPEAYANFYLAATGAGAALIGLLFVAISLRPQRLVYANAHPLARAATTSAFTALVNGFFISFTALLPGTNLGQSTLVLGVIGALNAIWSGFGLVRHLPHPDAKGRGEWLLAARGLVLVAGGLVLYGLEIYNGVLVIRSPNDAGLVSSIGTLVVGVFALGLARVGAFGGATCGSVRVAQPALGAR